MPQTEAGTAIRDSILKAIRQIADNYEGLILAALYISFDEAFKQICIYRVNQDTDKEITILTDKIIPWSDSSDLDKHAVYARLEDIVNELNNENAFYPIRRYTPFYIYYADRNSATNEKLITISGEDPTGANYNIVDDILDIFDGLL